MPDDPAELLTSGEVARRLGVTPRTVAIWASTGKLRPTVRTPGGRLRWRWSDVVAQLREQGDEPPTDA